MNEDIIIPIQEEVDNKEVLDASAKKLAVIASKLAEIFKAGFDAGFIGAKSASLLKVYKAETLDKFPLICQATMEPATSIDKITVGYKNSFHKDWFNRTPKVGDIFFCAGRTQTDNIFFHMTAKITGFADSNPNNATFEAIEVVPTTNALYSSVEPTEDNHIANKKYVEKRIADLINGAPGALDTIKELADALKNDANAFSTLMAEINKKVPIKTSTSGYNQLYGTDKNGKVTLWDIYQTITSDNEAEKWKDLLLNSIVTRDSTDGYAYTITPIDDGTPSGKELMRIANVKYVLEKINEKITELINGAPDTLDTLKELADALNGDNNAIAALTSTIAANKSEIDAEIAALSSTVEANKTEVHNYIDDAVKSAHDTIIGDGTIGLTYKLNVFNNNSIAVVCTGIGNTEENNITIAEHILGIPVQEIGYSAFKDCTSLRSVHFGNALSTVGISAFEGCTNLWNIYGRGANIGGKAFKDCTSLSYVSIGEGATGIGNNAFENCTSLPSIVIPDSVTSIDQGAFYGCTSLTSITIPDNVTLLGSSAFYGCTSLNTVKIGESVGTIHNATFTGCTKLRNVYIDNKNISIADGAFKNCTITNVYFIGTQTEWEAISKGSNNGNLSNANIICKYLG